MGVWHQMSRSTAEALQRAEHEQRVEAVEALARADAAQDAAAGEALAYYYRHGETRLQTHLKRSAEESAREQAQFIQRQQAKQAEYQDYCAQQMLSGRRWRTHAEILAAARGMPG